MEVEVNGLGYLDHGVEKRQGENELLRKCSPSQDTDLTLSTTASGCFDCNICLGFVAEPVVTLCGHLYCWPCIYKWLQVGSMSSRHCPVCKASLSQDTLVPLYCRGDLSKESDSEIPQRSSLRHQTMIASLFKQQPSLMDEQLYDNFRTSMQQPQLHHQYEYNPSNARHDIANISSLSSPLPSPVFHIPTQGLVGGLVTSILPWVFRNQEVSIGYDSQYHLTVSRNSTRLRRQQMQVESSLHQTWLFLFCFAVLGLLLF